MTAAVTGATGFLGRALLRRLAADGVAVRALVRRAEDQDLVRSLGATPVPGHLDSPAGCAELVRPGDVVYHAAARVDLLGAWRDFVAGTIDTTRSLLAAALPRRPGRFVYISSAGVYLGRRRPGPVSADTVPARPARGNYYGRAKLAAEALVRAACAAAGCPWVIVRLGFLYGPGNRALHRRLTPLLQAGRACLVGRGDNRIATLHVDDAAAALAAAGTHPAAAGRVYDVASAEPVTQRAFLDGLADALGLPRCRRQVPYRAALAAAGLAELAGRLTGRTPPFTRAMVALMGADQVVDAGRIQDELGWRPRMRFADGIRHMRAAERAAAGAG